MRKRPHPLAVFAANDQLALDVLEACEHAQLAVPDQVAIVGAENYLLAPNAMPIPISSVDTNLEVLGYRGAELLDRLMSGKPAPKDPIRVPPAGLVPRQSSDLLAVAHAGVARSLRFLWEHSHEPITVKDLVGVAAMSRRSLHTAFLGHLGRTPGQELHRVRIERAKRLLGNATRRSKPSARIAVTKGPTASASPLNRPPACLRGSIATSSCLEFSSGVSAERRQLLPDPKQRRSAETPLRGSRKAPAQGQTRRKKLALLVVPTVQGLAAPATGV